jgi:hypothetical protein
MEVKEVSRVRGRSSAYYATFFPKSLIYINHQKVSSNLADSLKWMG